MIEELVLTLQTLPVWGILWLTLGIAYIENLFPPSPSDLLLVFIGTLVGFGTVSFTSILIVATIGSVAGFVTAYAIGRRLGLRITNIRWLPFLSVENFEKVERLFARYHGLIVIGNRFIPGTRAIIAFAAGATKLPFPRTAIYSALSATLWNAILIWFGSFLGERWREADAYLSAYGTTVTILLVIAFIIWAIVAWRKRRLT